MTTAPTTVPTALGAALDREARRALVEGRHDLDGIDFVEVIGNYAGSPAHVPGAPQQQTLLVHLLNGAVPDHWDAGRVRITGGVRPDPRVNPVGVEWAYPALTVAGPAGAPLPPGVAEDDRRLVDSALPPRTSARRRVLVVRTTTSGDRSTYTLALLGRDGVGIPRRFDPPLASAPFSFTVDCPSDADCRPPRTPAAGPSGSPLLDYLARDYEALRTRLLDRLSTLLPLWTDRSPADPVVMLAELFAFLGDRLAYWQDAVGVEAYLGTARQRTSVRRHARLLDYAVHEGCSARVWLALSTDVPTTLRAGAAVVDTVPAGSGLLPVEVHENGGAVFETTADVALDPARNQLPFHSWGDPEHVLAAGTTSAFLSATTDDDPGLRAGDVLVLADFPSPGPDSPSGGPVESGDPGARHAVRLDRDPVRHTDPLSPGRTVLQVHWHPDDALPAPLRVSETAARGGVQLRAVALANVALADHGATVDREALDPPQPTAGVPYRPRVPRGGLAFVDPPPVVVPGGFRTPMTLSAADLLRPDPRRATAALVVDDGERLWQVRPDLVTGSRFDAHVVVEPEADRARLRFGDGVTGRAPAASQAAYQARFRLGGGVAGNVAAGRLTRWVTRADGRPVIDSGAAVRVWNPLPAAGGAGPEDLARVRQLAPAGIRTQLRAVTVADYAAAAETVPGVQRSVGRRRWAGSWYVHEVVVDPDTARSDDPAVDVARLLEVRRMAGVDVTVSRPVYVPLHIELVACLAPGHVAADIEVRLQDVLSSRSLPGGARGLFHPDRFTFGQPLYVSDLVAAAMAVPGVVWVDVTRFERMGDPATATAANLGAGRISVGGREVLRCDSDPNDPEAGRVDVVIGGRT